MPRIRIIGGIYRSQNLVLPPLEKKIRPTQDRVREAVFSILTNKIKDSIVLDLFAGSGAYGFEALSRGASKAYFSDIDKRCIDAIKGSKEKLKLTDEQVEISLGDYKLSLKKLKSRNINLDIVFLDPPYDLVINKDIIEELNSLSLLNKGAIIVSEQEEELLPIQGFTLKTYKYSYKRVGIYIKED